MNFVNNLLSITMAVVLIVVVGGLVEGSLTGNDFGTQWIVVTFRWFHRSATAEPEANPEPFSEVAKGAAKKMEGHLDKAAQGTTDIRLASCPKGSVDGDPTPLSYSKANAVKKQIAQGSNFESFIEVQQAFGLPHCNVRGKEWRYIVQGGRMVKVKEGSPFRWEWINW